MGSQEKAFLSSEDAEPAVATWATKPMRFGKAFKRSLKQSKNLDVYVNANVVELVPSEDSRSITSLTVKTMDNRTISVFAGTVILAAGGLENARLLLASNSCSEAGIGNEYDQVGRYFLDHPRAIFGSIRVNESVRLPYLTGIPITTGKIQYGIGMSEDYQRRHGCLNCYASLEPELSEFAEKQYGRSINVLKVLLRRGHAGSRFRLKDADMSNVRELIYLLTPKEIMPHFLYKPYALLKQKVRRRRAVRRLSIINYCEQVPDPDSRVTLSADTDALGMKKLRVNWRLGDDVRRSVSALQEALGSLVKLHGIGELEVEQSELSEIRFSDASHHIGTTRMSETPTNGIVDSNCRVHGVDNLYICSSSVFPTGGYANPTSTILALTLRLADHLKTRGFGV
jgi:choline dehydrogenase-like flavoprotein